MVLNLVVEEDPIKQGLKHDEFTIEKLKFKGCRGRSNKTRIETQVIQTTSLECWVVEEDPIKQGLKPFSEPKCVYVSISCRGRSNKTRIETRVIITIPPGHAGVVEEDPIKQGLKLGLRHSNRLSGFVL